MDVDSPLDLLLLDGRRGRPGACRSPATPTRRRSGPAWRRSARSPPTRARSCSSPGRTSAADLRWLERDTRSRTRALVEERGLRTAAVGAPRWAGRTAARRGACSASCSTATARAASAGTWPRSRTARCSTRRVLLAHRLGRRRARAGRRAEDRFASDLLLPDRGRATRGWRELTAAALDAPDPGPARRARAGRARASAWRSGADGPAIAGAPYDRPRWTTTARPSSRLPPRAAPGPRGRGRGRGAGRAHPGRDRGATARSPSRGSWSARCTSRATATTGGRSPGPGRAGDFLTAPEAHPIFGAAIGRLLEQAWDALGRPVAVHRHASPGPGRARWPRACWAGCGTWARRCSTRSATGRSRWRRRALDGAPAPGSRRARPGRARSTTAATPGDRRDGRRGGERGPRRAPGPPRGRPRRRPPRAARRRSTATAASSRLEAEPDDAGPRRAPRGRGRRRSRDGQVTEVCLARRRVAGGRDAPPRPRRRRPRRLRRGARGPPRARRRPDGTLRAFARHAVGGDPFRHVGPPGPDRDRGPRRGAGGRRRAPAWSPIGETTQAELLAAVGTAT